MSPGKRDDRSSLEPSPAAVACMVISDVLTEIADRAFERARESSEAGEFCVWLAECYDLMAAGAGPLAIEGVTTQELPGGEPDGNAVAWVADQLDHEAAYLRGEALTPGAEAERLAARGAEKLVGLLREMVADLEEESA